MTVPYADIHHFEPGHSTGVVDSDGDPCLGFYFQLMEDERTPLTALVGPYNDHVDCEVAAQKEFNNL